MITSQIAVLIHFQIVRMRTFGPDLNVDQKRICDAFLTRDNEIFGFSGPKIGPPKFRNLIPYQEQWETHLSNIVKWIYDEKEARSYLETVANNLSHEIQMLKEQPTLTNSLPNGQKSDWQTLRQKKKNNQQLLELQSALQEELQRREALFKGKILQG